MSDSEDDGSKTEQPSEKRLGDARGKGNVWHSREFNLWFQLFAVTIMMLALIPKTVRDIGTSLRPFVERPESFPFDAGNVGQVLFDAIAASVLALIFPLAVLVATAVIPNLMQTGFLFAVESIKPSWSKISLIAGFKRLFSLNQMVELAKSVAKLVIVGGVAFWLLYPELSRIDSLVGIEVVEGTKELAEMTVLLMAGVVAVMTVLGGLDIFYQRFTYYKKMMMSKQDVKEEFKQQEGDPLIRMRLRQIRFEKARQRMMAAVPKSDVVVTNPTHYAVALEYKAESMHAPKLVAKGADLMAKRIRDLAAEHKIPIVENPPVARTLYATVEVDQEIPPEHYKIVAEIISYVFKLKRKAIPN
jgi:flagellar biosynthetic protein FlhB